MKPHLVESSENTIDRVVGHRPAAVVGHAAGDAAAGGAEHDLQPGDRFARLEGDARIGDIGAVVQHGLERVAGGRAHGPDERRALGRPHLERPVVVHTIPHHAAAHEHHRRVRVLRHRMDGDLRRLDAGGRRGWMDDDLAPEARALGANQGDTGDVLRADRDAGRRRLGVVVASARPAHRHGADDVVTRRDVRDHERPVVFDLVAPAAEHHEAAVSGAHVGRQHHEGPGHRLAR